MIRLLLTLVLLLMSYLGVTQQMQLEDCIKYALANNLTVATAQVNTDITKEKYRQAKRNMLPIVESAISGTQLFGKSIDPNTNSYVAEGSILSANMYVGAQLNLFEGFKRQNMIRYNKLQHLMSKEDCNQAKMELAFQVMHNYYDVLYFEQLQQIADEQIKLTQLNLENTEKLIELGLKAESDLLEMRAQEAAEIHNRITVKNKKETALLALKKLMHFPLSEVLELTQEIISPLVSVTPSIDSIFQIAYTHMPLLKKSELNVKAVRKSLAMQRGDLFPSLSFGGNLSSNYADSWKKPIDPNNTDLGYKTVSFRDQIDENISKRIFLRLQIPIFSRWANRSAIKTAKYELQIARNELENTALTLRQEIVEEYQQLTALKEEKRQLQNKQQAMQEAYRIAEKKLEQGLVSVMDFYAAKNQLANAEAELLRTQLQLKIKEKTIDFYLGKAIY